MLQFENFSKKLLVFLPYKEINNFYYIKISQVVTTSSLPK